MECTEWFLLLHQIPPKPPYFRAQVLRRLMQAGALPIKNSAYLLPQTDEALEDCQWICGEIVQEGGNAWLFRADTIAGMTDDEIRDAFRQARTADYQRLEEEATNLLRQAEEGTAILLQGSAGKLARRIQLVRRIDFFDAPGYKELEGRMKELDRHLKAEEGPEKLPAPVAGEGKQWVTRRGIKVDRIASAWLIRRFLDPGAQFRFVDPASYKHQEGELRFDMFDGEFTHQGGLCTFEVLMNSRGVEDQGLRAIAEIVHTIDLKDERYERPETAGVSRMIDGICVRTPADEARLELGQTLFDTLYESYRVGAS